MKYFIANWKARKNQEEAITWVQILLELISQNLDLKKKIDQSQTKIIICPPFPFLNSIKEMLSNWKNIELGCQDLSSFDEGSYTGEVAAKSLQGLVNYAIIGHSERRKFFNETNELLFKKVDMARKYRIEPIFCIRDEKDIFPKDINYLAYEPVYAIGTGLNESSQKVTAMEKTLNLNPKIKFIYGGSVNSNNYHDYSELSEVDGFLIGTACIDVNEFFRLLSIT